MLFFILITIHVLLISLYTHFKFIIKSLRVIKKKNDVKLDYLFSYYKIIIKNFFQKNKKWSLIDFKPLVQFLYKKENDFLYKYFSSYKSRFIIIAKKKKLMFWLFFGIYYYWYSKGKKLYIITLCKIKTKNKNLTQT